MKTLRNYKINSAEAGFSSFGQDFVCLYFRPNALHKTEDIKQSKFLFYGVPLTLSWRRSLSYRHQCNDLQMNWPLCFRDRRHERVKDKELFSVKPSNPDNVVILRIPPGEFLVPYKISMMELFHENISGPLAVNYLC